MRRVVLAMVLGMGLAVAAAMALPASGGHHTARAGMMPGYAAEITATSPTTLYLPFVTRNWRPPVSPTWYSVYFPPDARYILAAGDDLTDTLDGDEIVEIGVTSGHLWVANTPPYGVIQRYHVARGYVEIDLSEVPQGEIVSASLELYTDMLSSIQGEFLIRFHEGSWSLPLSKSDWSAYGDLLGVYDTRLWEGPGLDKPIWVPLPALVGRPVPQRLRLVMRGEEETNLPYGWEQFSAHLALVWGKAVGGDGSVVSRLHLGVVP